MVYTGYCDKQNKNYSVEFKQISVVSLNEKSPKFINGRLVCEHAGLTGCCNSPSQCSILKSLNK